MTRQAFEKIRDGLNDALVIAKRPPVSFKRDGRIMRGDEELGRITWHPSEYYLYLGNDAGRCRYDYDFIEEAKAAAREALS